MANKTMSNLQKVTTVSNLKEVTTVSNSDVLLVETSTETLKVTKGNLLKEVNEELNAKSDANHTHDEYVTESELNSKGLATEMFVTNKIAEAQLGNDGGNMDLSGYATTEYVDQEVGKTNAQLSEDKKELQTQLSAISLNVNSFGAKSNDSTFDNTKAFNDCIEFIKNNRFSSAKIIIPSGEYYVDGTINCVIPPVSSKLTDGVTLVVEGTSGGTLIKKRGGGVLFNLQYGSHIFRNIQCECVDNTDTTVAFDIGKNSADSIEGVVSGSYFENIKTFRFNKHFNIKRMFDSQFSNCGAYVINGENGVGLNFESHTYDNTNNVAFYRCHFEGTNHNSQRLLKITGRQSHLIPEINFFACHFENNGKNNSPVLEIDYGQNINFNGCQITNNGWDNESHTSVFISNSIVHFYDCLFGKNASNSPKFFNVSSKSTVLITGGYIYVQEETSLGGLYDKDSSSIFRVFNFLIRDLGLDVTTNEIVINSENFNNRRFVIDIDEETSDLNIYHQSEVRGVNKYAKLSYSTDGKLYPSKGIKGHTYTIENGASLDIGSNVFDSSKNHRGTFIIQVPYNGLGSMLAFSQGDTLFKMTECDLFNVNGVVDGKINLTVDNRKIIITNKSGATRLVSLIPFQF